MINQQKLLHLAFNIVVHYFIHFYDHTSYLIMRNNIWYSWLRVYIFKWQVSKKCQYDLAFRKGICLCSDTAKCLRKTIFLRVTFGDCLHYTIFSLKVQKYLRDSKLMALDIASAFTVEIFLDVLSLCTVLC